MPALPVDARGQSLALPVPTNTGRPKLAPINGGTGPAPLADPGSSSSKPQAPLPPSGPQAPSPNPAEATTYQTSHHALVPRTRVKHSHSARAARAPPTGATAAALQRLGLGPDDATATGRRSGLSVAALGLAAGGDGGAALLPGRVGIGPGAWGGASSVGDLEALDAILDQLVVLDVRMRQALLRGPLVSFETVVSESAARQGLVTDIPGEGDAAARDRTFLTSVRGVVEEAPEEEEEEAAAEASSGQQPQQRGQQQQQSLPSIPGAGDAAGVLDHMRQGGAPHNHHGGEDVFGGPGGEAGLPEAPGNADALRGAMPVPILPKLARMYITSKAATACKAPPPAPPTAQWLLRSRLPVPTSEAPTYDTLVTQIKDVQRQYTCGTARDKATLAAEAARGGGMLGGGGGMGGMAGQHARTALDAYISGIDGPPLADVVPPQLAPSVTVSVLGCTFVEGRLAVHGGYARVPYATIVTRARAGAVKAHVCVDEARGALPHAAPLVLTGREPEPPQPEPHSGAVSPAPPTRQLARRGWTSRGGPPRRANGGAAAGGRAGHGGIGLLLRAAAFVRRRNRCKGATRAIPRGRSTP